MIKQTLESVTEHSLQTHFQVHVQVLSSASFVYMVVFLLTGGGSLLLCVVNIIKWNQRFFYVCFFFFCLLLICLLVVTTFLKVFNIKKTEAGSQEG